jgi:1,4-alpha-glucan branching enzyme
LDYNNGCTQQFISDACRFWLDTYALDGIRLDYTLGFYLPDRPDLGVGKLVADLRANLEAAGQANVSLVLEHLSDNRYEAINVANVICADGCWYDRFLHDVAGYAAAERINSSACECSTPAETFVKARVRCPILTTTTIPH